MSDKKPSNSFVVIASAIGIMFLVGILILTIFRAINLQSVINFPRAMFPNEDAYTSQRCKADADNDYNGCMDGCSSYQPNGSKQYCEAGCVATKQSDYARCGGGGTLNVCQGESQCGDQAQCVGGIWVCPGDNSGGTLNACQGESQCGDQAQCVGGIWVCPGDRSGGGGTGGGTGTSTTTAAASAQSCNSSSPPDVWSCYQKGINGVGVGNCAWCWAKHNGTATGGSAGGGGSCYNSCYGATGNGSGCKIVCEKAPACFEQCVKNGKNPSSCIVPCANGTYATPTPKPGLSPTPTPEPISDEEVCQGNVDAPTNCFSCLKDKDGDQLNIYDFACFSSYYGETVGKN